MIKGIITMTYCFFNKNNTIDLKEVTILLKLFRKNNESN